MFNTKNLVLEDSDVPSYWVFQYYLDLPEQLTGQDIKIDLYLILMKRHQVSAYMLINQLCNINLKISQQVKVVTRLT